MVAAATMSAQLTVLPANPVVPVGTSVQFTAGIPVTWSMTAGSLGTIDGTGRYQAPAGFNAAQQAGGCQLLPNNHIFNTRIDALPVHSQSSAWIQNGIDEAGGRALKYTGAFGLNQVDSSTAAVSERFLYTPANNGTFPLSSGLPGPQVESGLYAASDGVRDRHVISVNTSTCQFYDMYNTYTAGTMPLCPLCTSQSGVSYGFSNALPVSGATDAAGMEIQPLAIRLEEIEAGAINHAVRFTRVHPDQSFLWPATTAASYGFANRMPLGARLRLAASFNISGFSPVAQILLTQLKHYGMILADAGYNWEIQTMEDTGADPAVISAFAEITSKVDATSFEVVDESSLKISSSSGQTAGAQEAVVATANDGSGRQTVMPVLLQGVTVGVAHSSETVQSGVSAQLNAWVHGTANAGLVWTMSPSLGTISNSGLYTAPAVSSPQTTRITVTSAADPSAHTSIFVRVIPAGTIRVLVAPSVKMPARGGGYGPDSTGSIWWPDMGSEQIPTVTDDWYPQIWPAKADTNLYYASGYVNEDWTHRFNVPNGTYTLTIKIARANVIPAGYSNIYYLESQGQLLSVINLASLTGNVARTPIDVQVPVVVTNQTLYFTLRNIVNSASSSVTNWPPLMSAFSIAPLSGGSGGSGTSGASGASGASGTSGAGASGSSSDGSAAGTAPGNSASFYAMDTTTQGNWNTAYGKDGYSIATNVTALPSWGGMTLSSALSYQWVYTTSDPRALSRGNNVLDRVAGTLYNTSSFTISVTPADTRQHKVSVYCLDWDRIGRKQKIEVLDNGNNVLDTQTVSSFGNGVYLSWNITGAVKLRFSPVSGVNAVVSGIFFDSPGTTTSSISPK